MPNGLQTEFWMVRLGGDEVSKAIQNEPKTYAQFFKSDNFSSGINFVSSSSANTGRAANTANSLNSRSTRTGQTRGEYTLRNEEEKCFQKNIN